MWNKNSTSRRRNLAPFFGVVATSPIKDTHMDNTRTRRRALTAFAVSLTAAIASVASLGCSSNGSSFDDGMGGSGQTNPTNNTSGSGTTDPTSTMGGTGQTNPTQATGGSSQPTGGTGNTAGSGNPTGGTGDTGGSAPVAGTSSGGGSGGSDTGPACPKPAGQICHEFIANDNGKNQVNYVNEFTGAKWNTPVGSTGANSPRTIEIVDNAKAAGGKAVLVSVNTGYVELDLSNGTKLLEVKAQATTNVTGACRMADGQTALGTDTNPAQIKIVNGQGVISRSFNLPAGANLRAINLDRATNHFWLSRTETVYELNDQGQELWKASMGAGTKGYAVWWREGGGAYASTGEPATIVEINKDKAIVATVGGRDNAAFEAYKLDFFSGFVRRPNGNYIVANWLGHLGSSVGKDTPMVIEFQPEGASAKVVWTWGSVNTGQTTITNVFVFR
jgi:hypothetical protein